MLVLVRRNAREIRGRSEGGRVLNTTTMIRLGLNERGRSGSMWRRGFSRRRYRAHRRFGRMFRHLIQMCRRFTYRSPRLQRRRMTRLMFLFLAQEFAEEARVLSHRIRLVCRANYRFIATDLLVRRRHIVDA